MKLMKYGSLESTAMPKATTQRKGSSLKHDPLAVQLRSGELDASDEAEAQHRLLSQVQAAGSEKISRPFQKKSYV
jgi:hypothetical protein